jgi:hypothetical protein
LIGFAGVKVASKADLELEYAVPARAHIVVFAMRNRHAVALPPPRCERLQAR